VLSLILLVIFTLILEFLLVACTLAIAERKAVSSAILSMLIEPVKLLSLLIVIASDQKILSIVLISLACGVGNFLTIWMFNRWRPK